MLDWDKKTDVEIVKFCTSQHSRFKSIRRDYETMYDMAQKLFLPRRYELSRMHRPGEQYGVSIYDPHPAQAVSKFAIGSTGNMVSREDTNPWWLQFVSDNQRLMEVDPIKQYMQDAAEQVRYGFSQATFYAEFPDLLKDAAVTYGAMTAEVDRVNDRVVFLTRKPHEHWVATDRFGKVIADHFEIKMTAWDLLDQFGANVLPADIVKEARGENQGNPFREYDVLHCIYRNDYRKTGSLSHLDKPYIMFYILKSAAGKSEGTLLSKEGSDWGVINLRIGASLGDAYPLTMALDAMTGGAYGNLLGKFKLRAAHFSVDPAKRVHQNLRQQIVDNKLNPGSNTYVSGKDEMIEAVMNQMKWPLTDTEQQEIHKYIDWYFHIPFFELLTAGAPDYPQITAYHASQVIQEGVTFMSPTMDAIQDTVLEPASSIVWNHETLAGRMPEPPDELLEFSSGRVMNQYMGRLAQLRRNLRQVGGAIEVLQLLEIFNKLFPNSLAKIREYDFLEQTLVAKGMRQDMFHTDEEMTEIEAGIQQREQQMMQLEMMEKMGRALPGMGKGIEQNSPAALLTGA